MPSLLIYRENDLLVEYKLQPGQVTIGRADGCDIALPGETVSRTHCILRGRRDRWEIIDRSRHGVEVDGERVQDKAPLRDGSTFTFGQYRVEVSLSKRDAPPTAPQEPDQTHEILLSNERDGLRVERAFLEVTEGAAKGTRHTLRHPRLSVGARGSHIELPGDDLVKEHIWLRISRGRAMVEPGAGPAWLDSERIRDITPLYADEEVRLGHTTLRVSRGTEEEVPLASRFGDLVADSRAMRRLFGTLRRMAGHHYTVLVIGESGTGKELISRGVHLHSPRADGPFIALNCGAISENLFESELFGHEKGAFTGADARRDGAFHEADGGTLFLDEVGELPEAAQAKLLRVLETGEVRRVGSTDVSYPDVRIVAATNRDLAQAVRDGTFREDLFFRLAVLSVEVPSLRQRIEDLPVLCRTLCRSLDPRATVSPDALDTLSRHTWPGNVRELRNVLTRAYVLGGPQIDVDSLSFHRISGLPAPPISGEDTHSNSILPTGDAPERAFLQATLERHGGNRSAAARSLGIARSTLLYKLKKHGLS